MDHEAAAAEPRSLGCGLNMPSYYCASCRQTLDYYAALPSGPLLQNDYQRQKHEKHTLVDPFERLQSIFQDPSTAAIRVEVEEALTSGPMEIDEKGRINFLAESGPRTGFRYEWGDLVEEQDLTKVVLSSNAGQRHQFPEARARLAGTKCANCAGPIFAR